MSWSFPFYQQVLFLVFDDEEKPIINTWEGYMNIGGLSVFAENVELSCLDFKNALDAKVKHRKFDYGRLSLDCKGADQDMFARDTFFPCTASQVIVKIAGI